MVEPKLNPEVIHNETDLLVAAIHIDRYVMDAMDRLEEDFAEINSLTRQTFNQLNKNKHVLNDKVFSKKEALNEAVSSNLQQITIYNERMETLADTPVLRLQRLCACCDRSAVFYGVIVETTNDDAVKTKAQQLTVSAFERQDILKKALGKECGCDDSGCRL